MALNTFSTIDVHKEDPQTKRYGIDHINKLLDEELSQLRALKSDKLKEDSIAFRKDKSQVEGLYDYQHRAQHVKSKSRGNGNERHECKPANVALFSEGPNLDKRTIFPDEFANDKRVVAKGEVPFFQVNSDGISLSWRLPRILGTRHGRVENIIQAVTDESMWENQRCLAKRHLGAKKLSGKLIKARAKIMPDLNTSDSSENEELKDSLVTVQVVDQKDDSELNCETEKLRRVITREERMKNKTFHLACTREQIDYKSATKDDDDDCTFCACPALLHERRPQIGGKSQRARNRMRAKKAEIESTFFPRIETTVEKRPEKKAHAQECEKCRKRLQTAEINRAALSTAPKPLSRKKSETRTDCITREKQSRPVTKQCKDEPKEDDNKDVHLPMLEYTAYLDNEGGCYILPGLFTLQKRDYNVWSRKGQRPASKPISSRTVMCGTSFPSLVDDQKAE